jgi:hypothetical protein
MKQVHVLALVTTAVTIPYFRRCIVLTTILFAFGSDGARQIIRQYATFSGIAFRPSNGLG